MIVWVVILTVVVCVSLFLVYASYSISAGIYMKSYCQRKTTRKVVALTFDDGPDADCTPTVLEVLREFGVSAAFFCIGEKCEAHPELLKKIYRDGHLIGNHSYTHNPFFPCYTKQKMTSEIIRTTESIERITGVKTTWFRPPFGVTNPVVAGVVRSLKLRSIGWSIRSFDTLDQSEEKILKRIYRQIKPGAVILMHDRMPKTASLLRQLLLHLNDDGYEVVRVDELFDFAE